MKRAEPSRTAKGSSAQTQLAEEVRAFAAMDLGQLREVWRTRIGEPPPLRSHDHLRRLLAWRLQAEALGGLDGETRRALAKADGGTYAPKLPVGARVTREWRGRRYEVEIGEDGVLYGAKAYRSLSEVAREITGVRWNGPRFFGLRAAAPGEQP